MSCQVTKLNHAKSHQDSADRDMPAPIITIPGIADAVQGNSDIGKSASVDELVSYRLCYGKFKCILTVKKQAQEMENITISGHDTNFM